MLKDPTIHHKRTKHSLVAEFLLSSLICLHFFLFSYFLLLERLLLLSQLVRVTIRSLLPEIGISLHLCLLDAVDNQAITRHANLLSHILLVVETDRTCVHRLVFAQVAPVCIHLD